MKTFLVEIEKVTKRLTTLKLNANNEGEAASNAMRMLDELAFGYKFGDDQTYYRIKSVIKEEMK